jgi:hypothetical protein
LLVDLDWECTSLFHDGVHEEMLMLHLLGEGVVELSEKVT